MQILLQNYLIIKFKLLLIISPRIPTLNYQMGSLWDLVKKALLPILKRRFWMIRIIYQRYKWISWIQLRQEYQLHLFLQHMSLDSNSSNDSSRNGSKNSPASSWTPISRTDPNKMECLYQYAVEHGLDPEKFRSLMRLRKKDRTANASALPWRMMCNFIVKQ